MFVIYGKSNCRYCDRAKELLSKKEIEFEYNDLNTEEKIEQFKSENPGVRTVPYILKDGSVIGGYTELVEYFNSSECDPQ